MAERDRTIFAERHLEHAETGRLTRKNGVSKRLARAMTKKHVETEQLHTATRISMRRRRLAER